MQRIGRIALIVVEVSILSALILATRCANFQEVFVSGNVYFTDADCYARMTRVRMCAEHPGLIVRHHEFENFPAGTTPHTTAPLDYLILGLSVVVRPLTTQPIDVAGALISPVLALIGGLFLWWWSRRMQFRYRWALLILYAISPILVHGAELGRPDHQSLSILLVAIALCAEWNLQRNQSTCWGIISGAAWAFAIWVTAYEPLFLFMIVLVLTLVIDLPQNRPSIFAKDRRAGWTVFVTVIGLAVLIERRVPLFPIFHLGQIFKNWSRTIGELSHVSLANPVWLGWCGYLFLIAPLFVWIHVRRRRDGAQGDRALPYFVAALLLATYALTIWQARWSYFLVLIFAMALPVLLESIRWRVAVWVAFALSIFPILREWDERIWPSEVELDRRIEQRNESVQLREMAIGLQSPQTQPFIAPWWLSPAIAYWSRQSGVAGSSHESLEGIADSSRFFMSEDWKNARGILHKRNVSWVFAYDSDRVAQECGAILDLPSSRHALCFVLDRTPSQAPGFLILSAQNGAAKLYRVGNKL